MTTETLLAISAGATFLLALAAFWVIWQNYIFRKREQKERLLKEIIEWAVNVKACGLGKDISDIASLTEKQRIVHFMALVSEKIGDFKIVLALGDYIIKLVKRFFKGDLEKAVESLVQALHNHISLLGELLKLQSKPITTQTFDDFIKYAKDIAEDIIDEKLKFVTDEITNTTASIHVKKPLTIATDIIRRHKQEKVDIIVVEAIDEATKIMPE